MANDSHRYETINPYPLERYEIKAVVCAQNRLALEEWLKQTISVYVEECEINAVK